MTTETTPAAVNTTATITSPIVTSEDQPVVSSPIVAKAPEPIVAAPAAESVPAVVPPAAEPVAPIDDSQKSVPDVVQRRINELTAKRYEAERAAKAAAEKASAAEAKTQELLAQLAKAGTPDPVARPAITEDEIEKRAMEKAALIAQANEFNKACNAIVETGKKDFKDTWDESIKNLGLVGAIGQGANPAFLETAIELKNPAAILNHLGKNLEEAERIAKLPPTRMAMELARVEAQLNAPVSSPVAPLPPVSNAPAPVIPVGGGAKPPVPSIDDPSLTTEQFMALRAEQQAARQKRYLR